MAQCKYCHASITRIDKEVCPFCGGKRPLDGTDTSTQDVTKIVDQLENAVEIKHKKKSCCCYSSSCLWIFRRSTLLLRQS